MSDIKIVSFKCSENTQAIIYGKAKLLHVLTELDSLAEHIAKTKLTASAFDTAKYSPHKLQLNALHFTVFTRDHGVANEGVVIAPSKITNQRVTTFRT